jgi:hypothetical protein
VPLGYGVAHRCYSPPDLKIVELSSSSTWGRAV